jgi:hypothetical protein
MRKLKTGAERRQKKKKKQLRQNGIHSIIEALIDWPVVCHGIMSNDFVFQREPKYSKASFVTLHQ